MATFGTPVSRGNDAQNALSCARDMQIAMREWEKERSEKNLPVIKHRIGIHYGRCVVGNIGSEERMDSHRVVLQIFNSRSSVYALTY